MPLLLLACNNKDLPEGVLPQNEMASLLVDVHIVDGSLTEVPQYPDSLYKHAFNKYQHTFEVHHTDSATFKKSFAYYAKKPDQLFDIYEKVLPVLKAKVDSSNKVRVKADSLERIKQNKLNEAIAKRAADSIARINKRKADTLKKKKPVPANKATDQKPEVL